MTERWEALAAMERAAVCLAGGEEDMGDGEGYALYALMRGRVALARFSGTQEVDRLAALLAKVVTGPVLAVVDDVEDDDGGWVWYPPEIWGGREEWWEGGGWPLTEWARGPPAWWATRTTTEARRLRGADGQRVALASDSGTATAYARANAWAVLSSGSAFPCGASAPLSRLASVVVLGLSVPHQAVPERSRSLSLPLGWGSAS